MERIIQQKLCEIESQHIVKMLYACESGSRAWGFASRDSDYDVRFVYLHQKDWCTGIDDLMDVIEFIPNSSFTLSFSNWIFEGARGLCLLKNQSVY